jgi:hypothetical protein
MKAMIYKEEQKRDTEQGRAEGRAEQKKTGKLKRGRQRERVILVVPSLSHSFTLLHINSLSIYIHMFLSLSLSRSLLSSMHTTKLKYMGRLLESSIEFHDGPKFL